MWWNEGSEITLVEPSSQENEGKESMIWSDEQDYDHLGRFVVDNSRPAQVLLHKPQIFKSRTIRRDRVAPWTQRSGSDGERVVRLRLHM